MDEKRHYNPVMVQHPVGSDYDSAEFSLATDLTDYNVKTNEANAFSNLGKYSTVLIRADQDIAVKFNSASNHSKTVNRNRAFEMDNLILVSNIYITNASGSTAAIKIIGVLKES